MRETKRAERRRLTPASPSDATSGRVKRGTDGGWRERLRRPCRREKQGGIEGGGRPRGKARCQRHNAGRRGGQCSLISRIWRGEQSNGLWIWEATTASGRRWRRRRAVPNRQRSSEAIDLASSLLVIWRQVPTDADGDGGGSAKHANRREGERAADGLGLLVTADLLEAHGRWLRPRRLRPRRWTESLDIAEEEGGSLQAEIQRPPSSAAVVLTPATSSSAGRHRRLDFATPKRNRDERGRAQGRTGGARDPRSATAMSSPRIGSTDQPATGLRCPPPGSSHAELPCPISGTCL
ncbi:hypothetical protein E2562_037823 [Oryza meyeriana var. granulata]|uniref:Uncharacterized protein n=1 Tax=Oryza meyeriana var. granulata TaxID=110450 RepID=A0A6G1C2C3_9ORYZ|nr:hypothetical protein E2562_037823 [Oryza meyeriana var. granulata]